MTPKYAKHIPHEKNKVSIGLINPKSPDNVHAVMRAAGNFRVDSVFYTGSRYPRALRLNPNAPEMSRKVSENTLLIQAQSLLEVVAEGMKIVCVEFAENAMSLPGYEHPHDVFYIFGPEDGTIDQEIIDRAEAVVYVPTVGCMNLSASVNVLLYDRLVKSAERYDSKELILASRDTNNTVKVRG
ncbi:23S rRNA methyltransferase [Methyloprofundus sedimenti]|uniref:23S rRNA methyltransferase n=1 Tax=Methyloprofundus sedimenti TaxID=1420851 RepID=A0A1V8M8I3_9GAMM|nr:TrmH family RNA methyltransferase [Methyloprofundus sedimenti]OQK17703.1 23S rRNA methyltransferase [Methyloprofundus sedimenti]